MALAIAGLGAWQILAFLTNLINSGLFEAASRVSKIITERRANNQPIQREDMLSAVQNSNEGTKALDDAIANAPPD